MLYRYNWLSLNLPASNRRKPTGSVFLMWRETKDHFKVLLMNAAVIVGAYFLNWLWDFALDYVIVNERNIPVMAAGKDAADDVVILSKSDYDSLIETLHLYGVPGMQKNDTVPNRKTGCPFLP